MDKIILLFCSFFSCVIVVNILFQFLNDRYFKTYANKYLYTALPIATIIIIMCINMLINPLFNMVVHILLFGVISHIFYYEKNAKHFGRIIEIEALFVVVGISEALGVFLIDSLLQMLKIVPESAEILQSVETTFSKIVLLFLYYVVFGKLWKKRIAATKVQYILYGIMFLYSLVNILAIAIISSKDNSILLIVIVGCTIFSNMYLLYFVRFSEERDYYKMQTEVMEQQQKIQYNHYEMQQEKYMRSVEILHDVAKHIRAIEKLYQMNHTKKAVNYTKEINDMLQPLVPFRYTKNSILNCLLSDEVKLAEKFGIKFKTEMLMADINFMEPMDIITLFGNLIDNAITASKKCEKNPYIGLFIQEYNEIISIRIENSICKSLEIKGGKIINLKGEKEGIGILNIQRCVEKYEGSIIYKNSKNLLICDIILNIPDTIEDSWV